MKIPTSITLRNKIPVSIKRKVTVTLRAPPKKVTIIRKKSPYERFLDDTYELVPKLIIDLIWDKYQNYDQAIKEAAKFENAIVLSVTDINGDAIPKTGKYVPFGSYDGELFPLNKIFDLSIDSERDKLIDSLYSESVKDSNFTATLNNITYLILVPAELVTGEWFDVMNDKLLHQSPELGEELGHCVFEQGICVHLEHEINKIRESIIELEINDEKQKVRYQLKKIKAIRKQIDRLKEISKNYQDGISLNELNDVLDKEYMRFKIIVSRPLIHETIKIGTQEHQQFTIKFNYWRRGHVNIVIPENQETIIVADDKFQQMLDKIIELKGAVPIYRKNNEIVAFRYQYFHVKESWAKYFDNGVNLVTKFIEKYRSRFLSSSNLDLLEFINSSVHIPCRIINGDAPLVWGTDMKKCFASHKTCKLYTGFPGPINHYAHDLHSLMNGLDFDFIQDKLGWWQIETDQSLKFLGNLSGVWTTPHLLFFKQHGIDFKIKFGCWSTTSFDIEFDPEIIDQKLYTIIIGKFQQKPNIQKQRWIGHQDIINELDHYVIASDGDKKEISTYVINTEYRQGSNISSYFYAYAAIQILERALATESCIGINIDELITTEPLPTIDGWKESVQKDFSKRTDWKKDGLFLTMPVTLFSLPKGNSIGWDKNSMRIVVTGAGGCGKSYEIAESERFLGVHYTTHTNNCVDDKDAGDFKGLKCLTSHKMIKHRLKAGSTIINHIGVLAVDETQLIPHGILTELLDLVNHGVKVILMYDPAQLGGYGVDRGPRHKELIEWSQMHKHLTQDRRSEPGDKIIEIKKKLWNAVMDDKIEPEQVRAFIYKNFNRTTVPADTCLDATSMVVGFTNPTAKKYNGMTTDKLQGTTIEPPNKLLFFASITPGRRDDYKSLIYTTVSRVRRFDQLFIMTSGKK